MSLHELHIPGAPPPSLNALLRMSLRARLAAKKDWKAKVATWALICKLPRRPLAGRPRVRFRFFFRELRRRDRDNLAASQKFALDSLVRFGTLADDSEAAIELLPLEILIDRANPRTQVLIEA